MPMYDEKVDKNFYNVSIDGYDLIAEEITPTEAYNRRETARKNIIGGTQTVIRTNYIPRDITFTTHLLIDPLHPDVYDDILKEWNSKPVEVVSKYMGGKFNAECIIKPTYEESPNYMKLEIQLVEIPDTTSLIPNDAFQTPSNEGKEDPLKITSNLKKKKKEKDKKEKEKAKSKGKEKKTDNKTSKSSKKKKKGSNITKTKNS